MSRHKHNHDPARHADVASDKLGDYFRVHAGEGQDNLAFAQVHALLAIYGQLAAFTDAVQVLALADISHPPVPEQAITPEQAAALEANNDLLVGWQPGLWPVHDRLDPRGWRWGDPLGGTP